jgi:hypothetical protein
MIVMSINKTAGVQIPTGIKNISDRLRSIYKASAGSSSGDKAVGA